MAMHGTASCRTRRPTAPGRGFIGHAPWHGHEPGQALRNARGQFERQHGEKFFRCRAPHGEQGDDAALRVAKAREGAGAHCELSVLGGELSLEKARRIEAAKCQRAVRGSTLRKVDTKRGRSSLFY
jgi:hypothetical protein